MSWPHPILERVTVCDVLDSGACLSGVLDYVQSHGNEIVGVADGSNQYIAAACFIDGYGYGYGDGYGDGNGYGNGYGDGYGDGNGYGDGDGDGSGSGSGSGNGNGNGNS